MALAFVLFDGFIISLRFQRPIVPRHSLKQADAGQQSLTFLLVVSRVAINKHTTHDQPGRPVESGRYYMDHSTINLLYSLYFGYSMDAK